MSHHAIVIRRNGRNWSCSCGMHGKALDPASTQVWASEHIVDRRDTKSIARQVK